MEDKFQYQGHYNQYLEERLYTKGIKPNQDLFSKEEK